MDTKDHVEALNAVAAEVNKRGVTPHTPDKDSAGYDKPIVYIGRTFLHTGRGSFYKVAGVLWDGARDLWMIVHHNVNPALSTEAYGREVANFTGKLPDGSPRYVEVHDVDSIRPPVMSRAEMPATEPLKVRANKDGTLVTDRPERTGQLEN